MESTVTVKINSIKRKVSQMKNIYHEINMTETHILDVNPKESIDTIWHKIYYPGDMDSNKKEDLIGKEASVVLEFYPVERKVNENTYTNINCHIKEIESI